MLLQIVSVHIANNSKKQELNGKCHIPDSDHFLGGGKESFEIANWNKELQLYNVSLLLIKKI